MLDQLSKTDELQPSGQYLLGLSLLHLNDCAAASGIFQGIIKNYPQENTVVQNCEVGLAKCSHELGDIKEALKKFKIVIYKYPNTDAALESLLWLGDYYLKIPDYTDAITYYRQAVDTFPVNEKIDIVRYQLGQAYQEQGALDEAINQYKLVHEAAKETSAQAKLAIAVIFSQSAPPQTAIDAYRKIISTSPEFARNALVKIAQIYLNEQEYSNSLNAYRDALKTDAGSSKISDAEIQFAIADMAETLNKTNEASEGYLKIPYLYPAEIPWVIKAYLRLARIFEREEDWQNAKLVYQKVVAYGTDEAKFAQERIDWIDANIGSAQKAIMPSTGEQK